MPFWNSSSVQKKTLFPTLNHSFVEFSICSFYFIFYYVSGLTQKWCFKLLIKICWRALSLSLSHSTIHSLLISIRLLLDTWNSFYSMESMELKENTSKVIYIEALRNLFYLPFFPQDKKQIKHLCAEFNLFYRIYSNS